MSQRNIMTAWLTRFGNRDSFQPLNARRFPRPGVWLVSLCFELLQDEAGVKWQCGGRLRHSTHTEKNTTEGERAKRRQTDRKKSRRTEIIEGGGGSKIENDEERVSVFVRAISLHGYSGLCAFEWVTWGFFSPIQSISECFYKKMIQRAGKKGRGGEKKLKTTAAWKHI